MLAPVGHLQLSFHRPLLGVSVDLLRAEVAILAGAEGVGRGDLLLIDVGNAEPGQLVAAVDSDDSEGGAGLSNVTPGDAQVRSVRAGLVRPALGGGVGAGHPDYGAALRLVAGVDGKVVVAASVALAAVPGHVFDRPCLALNRLRVVVAGSPSAGSRGGSGRNRVGKVIAGARARVGRVAAAWNTRDRGPGGLRYFSGEVGTGARTRVSRIAATGDARDRSVARLRDGGGGVIGRARSGVSGVAAAWNRSRSWVGLRQAGGRAGTPLAVAGVVLAQASGQLAAADDFRSSGRNTLLVGVLAGVLTLGSGSGGGSESQDRNGGSSDILGEHGD